MDRVSDHRCAVTNERPATRSCGDLAARRRLPVHASQEGLLTDMPEPDGLPPDPLVPRLGGRTPPGPGARRLLLGLLLGAAGRVRGSGRAGSAMGRNHRGGRIRGEGFGPAVWVRPRDWGRAYRRRRAGCSTTRYRPVFRGQDVRLGGTIWQP